MDAFTFTSYNHNYFLILLIYQIFRNVFKCLQFVMLHRFVRTHHLVVLHVHVHLVLSWMKRELVLVCIIHNMYSIIKCHMYMYESLLWTVFLISLYGTPLPQRASYLALQSFLFGPVMQVIMIISLTALTLC